MCECLHESEGGGMGESGKGRERQTERGTEIQKDT